MGLGNFFKNIMREISGDAENDRIQKEYDRVQACVENAQRLQDKYNFNPGQRIEDGSFFVGYSSENGDMLFTTSEDVPLVMDFKQASNFSKTFNAHGKRGWQLPSEQDFYNILEAAEQNPELKKTINYNGKHDKSAEDSWYITKTEYQGGGDASSVNPGTNKTGYAVYGEPCSVRFVRSANRLPGEFRRELENNSGKTQFQSEMISRSKAQLTKNYN